MTADSYTTVDRNKLLRRCEVIADSVIAMREKMKKEGRQDLRNAKANIPVWRYIFEPRIVLTLKRMTESDLENDAWLNINWPYIMKGSKWCWAAWDSTLEGEKEVKQLMKQLRAEAAQPTILLSTAHICALDAVEATLKEKGMME